MNKPNLNNYITTDGKYYVGSSSFLNSYLMNADDRNKFFVTRTALLANIRDTNPYVDIIPSRSIVDDWEIINVSHRTGYHDMNLSNLDPAFPKVTIKVVTINFLIMYVSMLWITLRVETYLSMFIKLLKIINRVYRLKQDSPLVRLIYPSVETYGEELPHVFDLQKDTFTKPTNIFINKYVSKDKAFESITQFEYPEIYNLDGM
jgi:hypothetical protein